MNIRKYSFLALVAGFIALSVSFYPSEAVGLFDAEDYKLETALPREPEPKAPVLPDLSPYTVEAVRSMAVLAEKSPDEKRISVLPMIGSEVFGNMTLRKYIPLYASLQGNDDPEYILLETGTFHLSDIIGLLPEGSDHLTIDGNEAVLRVPLITGPGTTLVINEPGLNLKMLQNKGAFLANFGRLYIVDSEITGWDGESNTPSFFKDMDSFRPFLSSWGGSRMYLANAKVSHLGYEATKSYGVTYTSSHKPRDHAVTKLPPTGWVVDSLFDQVYFGFYTYEAVGVAVVRNTYKDNIVYGIDPHDRSRALIIAHNEVFGTQQKHGIIMSREVDESFIFNNKSYNNKGSGFMLDRHCQNNIIAYNEAFENEGDGMSFYESPNNMTWENNFSHNKRSGIRVRNSRNVKLQRDRAVKNGLRGVEGYTHVFEKGARGPEDGPV